MTTTTTTITQHEVFLYSAPHSLFYYDVKIN